MVNPWDENARLRHDQVLSGKDLSFTKLMAPEMLSIIRGYENHGALSLFEIGCGTGILTHWLSELVHSVVAIDDSEESCKIARDFTSEDKNVVIFSSGVEELMSSYISFFDVVLAHMVFHTVEHLDQGLVNISAYLKRQGKFIFSIPHPCFFSFYKVDIKSTGYNYINPSLHEISFTISNDHNPLPSRVPYFHRPLSFYSDHLWKAGFTIERIREPFPDDELLNEYKTSWDYPRYIIFECQKLY